jgi:DNA-binding winged helix-turn-helix (wHTH) protein/alpha-beta hydrolase superfamily lysophospholipase
MIYGFEDYELDTALFELRRAGERYPLEPQVFELLRYLIEHHDRMVPKDELLDHIWPERYISEAALNSRLMAARKAIGDNGRDQRLIRTLHGRGYRFVGDVRVGGREASTSAAPATPAVEVAARVIPQPSLQSPPAAEPAGSPAPLVRYAPTPDGNYNIAYATLGEGIPLVRAPGWFTHLDFEWRWPRMRRLWELLAEHFMLVRYDARGVGLSDPAEEASIDTRLGDLEAVVEALGLERFVLLGTSPGGVSTGIRYAVANPGRVSHLVLHGGGVNVSDASEHQAWVRQWEMHLEVIQHGWGSDLPIYRRLIAELLLGDSAYTDDAQYLAELHGIAAPASRAHQLIVRGGDGGLVDLAPRVNVPTLITHARDDPAVPLARARRLAGLIPDATLVVLDGASHWLLDDETGGSAFVRAVIDFVLSSES